MALMFFMYISGQESIQ